MQSSWLQDVVSFLKTSWWGSSWGWSWSRNTGLRGHQYPRVLHVVVARNVPGPWKHAPDLLDFKSINMFDKALSSKVGLLNFHKETNLALWLYFYFYLLHSLIPRWIKHSVHVKVHLISWKQLQLAHLLGVGVRSRWSGSHQLQEIAVKRARKPRGSFAAQYWSHGFCHCHFCLPTRSCSGLPTHCRLQLNIDTRHDKQTGFVTLCEKQILCTVSKCLNYWRHNKTCNTVDWCK